MNNSDLIDKRKTLQDIYLTDHGIDLNVMKKNFYPEYFAAIRDSKTYKTNPYNTLFKPEDVIQSIYFKEKKIIWLFPEDKKTILNICGLKGFNLKPPCTRRISYVNHAIDQLSQHFEKELELIFKYTKTLCWIEPYQDTYVGNASYYEIPHCTFFSDAALFSIPPEIHVPDIFSDYSILENLYHESLHHQLHYFSATKTKGYFSSHINNVPEIEFGWRKKCFTVLEALHALHIYSFITPLRIKYYTLATEQNLPQNFEWLLMGIQDGLRMWKELAEALMKNKVLFKVEWEQLIQTWQNEYYDFMANTTLRKIFDEQSA